MTCGRSCSTCNWWSNVDPAYATAIRRPVGADPDIGICQFSPPVVLGLAGLTMTRFPETHATRGCGQWTDEDGGGPDDGERIGQGGEAGTNVTPFRRVTL